MLPPKLSILLCGSFRREVEALSASCPQDVEFGIFGGMCGEPPLSWEDLGGTIAAPEIFERVIIVGGCCLANLASPPAGFEHCTVQRLSQCFSLLAGDFAIARHVQDGAYLVTPGWLEDWRGHLSAWGFDPVGARNFFRECCRRIVMLDTGTVPQGETLLAEFASAVDRPFQSVPTGNEMLRLHLERYASDWRVAKERVAATAAVEQAQRSVADYATAFDLLGSLTRMLDEEEVVRRIVSFYSILFAAHDVAYVSLVDGVPGKITRFGFAAGKDDEWLRQEAVHLDIDSRLLPPGDGFLLKIRHDGSVIGMVSIDGITLPHYRNQYLNLAMSTAAVWGLAIGNARSFQQIREMTSLLHAAKEAAEETSRFKSRFLATMSHEIRTPMTAIVGINELLLNSPLDEAQKELVSDAAESMDNLLKIINDILDFSKIEEGKSDIVEEPFSLTQLWQSLRRMFEGVCRKKGLEFAVTVDGDADGWYAGDALRIRQILTNLINNACKFTTAGHVHLRIEQHPESVVFVVGDSGIGIPPDKLESIFDLFAQVDSSSTRRHGGTGLGLTISRRFAELMGGTLTVESRLGHGSAFTLTLPLRKCEGKEASLPAGEEASSREPLPMKIVVVDDNEVNRRVVHAQLARLVAEAAAAGSGEELLDLLRGERFDLVITDISMPGMDGVTVLRQIRGLPPANPNRNVPVIAYTAHVLQGDAERFLTLGFNGYLAKPARMNDLLGLLERRTRVCTSQSELTSDGISLVDRSYLERNLLDYGLADVLRDMIKAYTTAAAAALLAMQEGARRGDLEAVADAAHTLKGSSGTVGAAKMASAAAFVEDAARENDLAGGSEILALIPDIFSRTLEEFEAAGFS